MIRGNISEQVQRAFKTGYDPKSKAIVLPIMDRHGQIVNFKYRKEQIIKSFGMTKKGQPVKQHLYGLHFVHQMKCKRVYIVEGEIDCLYLWSHRIPAIATFGASLSKKAGTIDFKQSYRNSCNSHRYGCCGAIFCQAVRG